MSEEQRALVGTLAPEFSDTAHVKGIVSMARGDDEESASTSFFIVVGDATELDGVYTAFGRVIGGMDAVDQIATAPVEGETPTMRIPLHRVRLERDGGPNPDGR